MQCSLLYRTELWGKVLSTWSRAHTAFIDFLPNPCPNREMAIRIRTLLPACNTAVRQRRPAPPPRLDKTPRPASPHGHAAGHAGRPRYCGARDAEPSYHGLLSASGAAEHAAEPVAEPTAQATGGAAPPPQHVLVGAKISTTHTVHARAPSSIAPHWTLKVVRSWT